MSGRFSRRSAVVVALLVLLLLPMLLGRAAAAEPAGFRLASFRVDVTPRLGHPLLGGNFAPARTVDDPLFAHGVVLLGAGRPIVLAAVDWCEIRNDAYARWRDALAKAAGTTADRVLLASVHQHDAPLADLTAQRLLAEAGVEGGILDLDFHERTVERVAAALHDSLASARPVTHLGLGQAKVQHVASNRRVVDASGKAVFARYSATRDAALRDLPEGEIDPWLKTISFWDGERPRAAISAYATHPMSYYGTGAISSEFVGLARGQRQQDEPGVFQMYLSGCSGDVTAGKYNDGSPENRRRRPPAGWTAPARARHPAVPLAAIARGCSALNLKRIAAHTGQAASGAAAGPQTAKAAGDRGRGTGLMHPRAASPRARSRALRPTSRTPAGSPYPSGRHRALLN